MNRTIWKLQQISERLWILAVTITQHAGALGIDGRGFAVIAEETRIITEKVQILIEKALFDDEIICKENIFPYAKELNMIALNAALESFRLWEKGKQAAVCADEMRKLSHEIMVLFEEKPTTFENEIKQMIAPWSKKPLLTVNQNNEQFMLITIAGIPIVENLLFIQEVFYGLNEIDGYINLRNRKLPVINGNNIIGKTLENPIYIVLQTSWADEKTEYAIATEKIDFLFHSPIGTPISPPNDMPLSKFVRECWDNENGEPFYFVDWKKLYEYRINKRTKR